MIFPEVRTITPPMVCREMMLKNPATLASYSTACWGLCGGECPKFRSRPRCVTCVAGITRGVRSYGQDAGEAGQRFSMSPPNVLPADVYAMDWSQAEHLSLS